MKVRSLKRFGNERRGEVKKQGVKNMRNKNIKLILLFSIIFFSVLLLPRVSLAGIYYVAPRETPEANVNDEGDDAWSNATNINTPCSAGTAMAHAVAGDTVYFRGGMYNIPFTGWVFQQAELQPSNSGTPGNPITFRNYPGEVPVLNVIGMPAWDDNDKKTQQAQILGNNYQDYIVYDGFHLLAEGGERMASLISFGRDPNNRARGIEIRNINVYGGSRSVTVDTNNDLIRIENTVGTIIANCKLYGNRNINSREDDTCAIKGYHNSNLLIEHNEISDCNTGIYLKSDDDDVEVRYNWIDNVVNAIRLINELGMESYRVTIHDNLFTNFTNSANLVDSQEGYYNNDFHYYNNTLYSPSAVLGFAIGEVTQGFNFYNNIIQVNASTALFRTRANTKIDQCDHNQWGSYPFRLQIGIWSEERYYDFLSSWQNSNELASTYDAGCGSSRHPGCGSLASNPLFENNSGNFNQIADFRLAPDSPCKGAGRNGVDMGANIDLVGIQGGTTPDTTPPLPPQGVRVE